MFFSPFYCSSFIFRCFYLIFMFLQFITARWFRHSILFLFIPVDVWILGVSVCLSVCPFVLLWFFHSIVLSVWLCGCECILANAWVFVLCGSEGVCVGLINRCYTSTLLISSFSTFLNRLVIHKYTSYNNCVNMHLLLLVVPVFISAIHSFI